MSVVAFNAANFKLRYPAFASVANATLQYCFNDSGLYLNNEDDSVVADLTERESLLWMLTAHIAVLTGVLGATGSAAPVGRTSSASRGTVSSSFEYAVPGTHQWFAQTQYGAMFLQATRSLRAFVYRPAYVSY